MTRWKLTLEYDGSAFVGWQRQNNGLSVQQALEEAIFAFCQQRLQTHAAGRTDAGVHATGQVVHLDLAKDTTAHVVRMALNNHLKPWPVVVLEAEAVAPDFHARFSAQRRAYRFHILNRRAPPALQAGRVWWVAPPLDVEAMAAGAARLLGQHDFTTFRATECQAPSPVKTLERFGVTRQGDDIHVVVEARSFLHHQVRNMVGTLKLVGQGKWTPDAVTAALEARDRSAGGPTAPPEGLYLTRVDY